MNLKSIIKLTKKDMQEVNKIIINELNSDVLLIKKISKYIIDSGGKKIRPIIAILIGKYLKYKGEKHINIAALVEFIHTATLLHDDVIDKSKIRRGKKTVNTIFGNSASILIGDFIYSKSFQMMTNLGLMSILKLMSDTTNIIAKGEIIQLMYTNNPNITEEIYMQIIYNKTARLFESTAIASAIVSGANKIQKKAFQNYGRYLGIAFQLINDISDYNIKNHNLNQNIGNDLKEGKLTLPLLHLIQNGTKKESDLIRKIIQKGNGINFFKNIVFLMKHYGSIEYTYNKAKKSAYQAIRSINKLPNSSFKKALINLAVTLLKI
ncbi:MAG: octaprenyl diphosphate synthase [Arsenophonus sp.]|nr:MAG: octaprenyl diphosphate synthase [Arsenophonus sp.]